MIDARSAGRMRHRSFIPWAEPKYWGNEEDYVLQALRSSWISGGPFVDRLEADLAGYCGAPSFVTTSNGTTAIHAAFLALGVRPGDEILVPGFAFMAAANVALHMGAKPVFADVDPQTWCVDAGSLARCITSKTRGIVPVHTYGNVCDMRSILRLASEHGLWVVEDAAEAFGSTYFGQQAGTIADIGTFSFHATKTITTGEGGGVATRSAKLRDAMRLYRSHGVSERRYFHDVAGHNFRLPNMQAAIGCAQLECIQTIELQRRRLYAQYMLRLAGTPGLRLQVMGEGVEPVVWAVAARLDETSFPQGRDAVMAQLAKLGIETRPGFHAASEMSHLYEAGGIEVSEALAKEVISLPSSPTVDDEEVAYIAESLVGFASA